MFVVQFCIDLALLFLMSLIRSPEVFHIRVGVLDVCPCSAAGYTRDDVDACVRWMEPYAEVLESCGPAQLRRFNQIPDDDAHNIQTHVVDVTLLVTARRSTFLLMHCHECDYLDTIAVSSCM